MVGWICWVYLGKHFDYVVRDLERCYVANEDDYWSSDITNRSIAVTVWTTVG